MGYKVVAGGIEDPGSIIKPNAVIKLIAKTNVGTVYVGSQNISLCDANGNYNINVAYGIHDVLIDYGQGFNRVGQIQVVDDTPSPTALAVLLAYEQVPTNAMVLSAQSAVSSAATSATAASNSATAAASAVSSIPNLTGTEISIGSGAGSGQAANAIAIGSNAGGTSQGNSSVSLGINAGSSNQSNSAVAIGDAAGESSQGQNAVAVGIQAGQNTQGGSTVSVGFAAGQTTQGSQSVAVGWTSGQTNQGDHSVAVGAVAGSITQGTFAVAIGANAGSTNQPANSICLNSDSDPNNASSTNAIVIGKSNYSVQIGDGSVQSVSDARDKYDVEDIPLGLDFINALSPKFYKYDIRELYETQEHITSGEGEDRRIISSRTIKNDPDGSKAGKRFHSGFLAQDVKQVMDDFGVDFGLFRDQEIKAEPEHKEAAKDKLSLCYQELIAIQAKAIQELSAKLDELTVEVNELKGA